MGTRSGDVDPALVLHLRRTRNLCTDEIDTVLNSRSGLLALAGDNDMREVHRRVAAGDDRRRARARRLLLPDPQVRRRVPGRAGRRRRDRLHRRRRRERRGRARRALAGLERCGIDVDAARNAAGETVISPDGASVAVLVVPTNEELEMATQAAALVRADGHPHSRRKRRRPYSPGTALIAP